MLFLWPFRGNHGAHQLFQSTEPSRLLFLWSVSIIRQLGLWNSWLFCLVQLYLGPLLPVSQWSLFCKMFVPLPEVSPGLGVLPWKNAWVGLFWGSVGPGQPQPLPAFPGTGAVIHYWGQRCPLPLLCRAHNPLLGFIVETWLLKSGDLGVFLLLGPSDALLLPLHFLTSTKTHKSLLVVCSHLLEFWSY